MLKILSTKIEVAKENTNVEQISAKSFTGECNGLPIVNDDDSVIGIVTAIDILKDIRKNKDQYYNSKRGSVNLRFF